MSNWVVSFVPFSTTQEKERGFTILRDLHVAMNFHGWTTQSGLGPMIRVAFPAKVLVSSLRGPLPHGFLVTVKGARG